MKKWFVLLLGLFLIILLSYLCFLNKAEKIKEDLTYKLDSSCQDKGISGVKGIIVGENLDLTRSIALTGVVRDREMKNEAEALARKIEGIGSVDNQLVIATDTDKDTLSTTDNSDIREIEIEKLSSNEHRANVINDINQTLVTKSKNMKLIEDKKVEEPSRERELASIIVPSPYIFTARKDKSKKITLEGYVANHQQYTTLVSKAETLFGAENVIDRLKEAKGTPVAWEESSLLGLEKLLEVDFGEFEISNNIFTFNGYVEEGEVKGKLLSEFKDKLNSHYIGNYNIDTPEVILPEITRNLSCKKHVEALLSREKIYFEYDKEVIKKQSYNLLDKLIETITECPKVIIGIEGHTDSDGRKLYNQKLSSKRANAVKNYLIGKGVEAKRLKAIGYGELRPVATNRTVAGKEKNRRIEFNLKGVE